MSAWKAVLQVCWQERPELCYSTTGKNYDSKEAAEQAREKLAAENSDWVTWTRSELKAVVE